MTAEAVVRLFSSLLEVRKLAAAIGEPLSVLGAMDGALVPVPGAAPKGDAPNGAAAHLQTLLDVACARFGMPPLRLGAVSSAALTSFEVVVSERLAMDPSLWRIVNEDSSLDGRLPELLEKAWTRSCDVRLARETVSRRGVDLNVYRRGSGPVPALVIANACGMPVELAAPWMDLLAAERCVVTWESRGFFADWPADLDAAGYNLDDQIEDLFEVMDHCGLHRAQVMGLCNGALVALRAAAAEPTRIDAVILGNGSFGLPACRRTDAEAHFAQLILQVARSRRRATLLQRLFLSQRSLRAVDREFAHLTLCPYANAEALHRYGRLSAALLTSAPESWIPRVTQPTLVVAGENDTLAHPEGSRWVARMLRDAVLYEQPNGTHLSLLRADPVLVERVSRFLSTNA